MIDTLWQDIKYATRSLRHTPGFTAAAIVTLALGMGANATIFTLLDAVLFKPLPVSRPDELLTVYENAPDAAAQRAARYGRRHGTVSAILLSPLSTAAGRARQQWHAGRLDAFGAIR